MSTQEGRELAEEYGMLFFETSAKFSLNIDYTFEYITQEILEGTLNPESKVSLPKKQNENGSCILI